MFQTNTPNDPPAATLTATATPSAATVSGTTNFICSRRLALRRSPYRHVASSSRGGLPTCTRSYACHRISATCAVAAATRPARAARARRSEEHTSELQPQFHLVCRLLLEKKKE